MSKPIVSIPAFRGIRKTFSGSSSRIRRTLQKNIGDSPTSKQDLNNCTSQSTASLTEGDADWIVRKTETKVAETVDRSHYIKNNCTLYKLPRFSHEELELSEDLLASGGFCEVRGIDRFLVQHNLDHSSVEPRRYVIKHLAPKLVNKPRQLAIGAKDLVMEGFIMSSLKHENILEVKGFASSGVSGYAQTGRIDGFFLVLPRLDKTLHKQLHEWKVAIKKQRRKEAKAIEKMNNESSAHTAASTESEAQDDDGDFLGSGDDFNSANFPFCTERIQTAVEIASAIAYCHRNRILYRDLKPANIGYSFEEDRVKLFDFGLAIELPPSSDPEATFKLPGNTGTARYMSPEIINSHHYGLKSDVFSFCMLLHEIMALVKPFDKLTGKEVKVEVGTKGRRPVIDNSWPLPIRRLLRRGFSETSEVRPSMEEIQDILEDLVDDTFQ